VSHLDGILKDSARAFPDRPALAWRGEILTYRDLDRRVDRLAARLANSVSPRQRVGILAGNRPALVVGMFAAWRVGAAAVPLHDRYREFELVQILENAELLELLCVSAHGTYSFTELVRRRKSEFDTLGRCRLLGPLGEVSGEIGGVPGRMPEPLSADIGVIHYTSGTTGSPKGALVREITPRDCATALNDVLQTADREVVVVMIPISHAFGFLVFMAALAAGHLVVLVESTFSLAGLQEAMHRHRATVLHGSPTLFASLLKSLPDELPSLRTGLVAGTICPPRLLEDLDRAGLRMLNSFGMTEIGAATSCRMEDPPAVRFETVGRPLPGYTFRISDGRNGCPRGEVQVRGRYVTPGYYRQPTQTAEAFVDDWLRTGDIGSIDEQGHLRILGRLSDVIHVAGLNVYPAEVEACLLSHPDVVEAVVVGLPHEKMGEVPGAVVIARTHSGLTSAQLVRYTRDRIAGYKIPYSVRLAADFPRLPTGKPDRGALAKCFLEQDHVHRDARPEPVV